ncbi:MAG: hypothetical protein A2508_01940 [Candidatus Lambdaproteobacteria bacterium RIFOXYD12_FULL_49_8]|uniref:Peptidase M14 domain-containing protein n=1 Tax=Candidatus Lambdaproteobacteria bacterium RIFOXYD2_FULL_50_16 TaxID=1817772 RepID=A0A1F6G9C5_9PROT|nr:MAG: hypothetical protein A2527_05725 [Candidatus Lambdaproteobacteria bacterium RIFOXYD2_FULL_50_16]OGG98198.1 MAG: hypothetical protein A2508_01940 [Candidatus Lambdaproteobacteria bacterium RIFOXYD12_FULL_49_8]
MAFKPILAPHLFKLESLIQQAKLLGGRHQILAEVSDGQQSWPVHALEMGSSDPGAPAIGFIGGVHGLERIGAEVVMEHLGALVNQLPWDQTLQRELEGVRLLFVPIVNPVGLNKGTRANAKGIDLMRNSPINALGPVTTLIGGHRISKRLPWYRGDLGAEPEPEIKALSKLIRERLLTQPFSMVLDCHSGYGGRDHLWFPYAFSKRPIDHLAEVVRLRQLFFSSYPYHRPIYKFSPQSRFYLTHGDLWDCMYLESLKSPANLFLPFTLEMGSWVWLKKSPRNAFRLDGFFNPNKEHRHQRVLRRHLVFLQFLQRATAHYKNWLPSAKDRQALAQKGLNKWFNGDKV